MNAPHPTVSPLRQRMLEEIAHLELFHGRLTACRVAASGSRRIA